MPHPQRSSRKPQTRPCCTSRDLYLQANRKCHPAALQTRCRVTALPQLRGCRSQVLPPTSHSHQVLPSQAAGTGNWEFNVHRRDLILQWRESEIQGLVPGSPINANLPHWRRPWADPGQVPLVFGHLSTHQLMFSCFRPALPGLFPSGSFPALPPAWMCPFPITCAPARLPQQLPNFQGHKK